MDRAIARRAARVFSGFGLRLAPAASTEDVFGGPLLRLCSGQATTREPRVLPRGFGLLFFVAEKAAAADDFGHFRRNLFAPRRIARFDLLDYIA